jgi:hypothetical protein
VNKGEEARLELLAIYNHGGSSFITGRALSLMLEKVQKWRSSGSITGAGIAKKVGRGAQRNVI